jgi:hypothetical protein
MSQEINNVLSEVEKVKISVVMQVNLTDYSGSRSDAVNKFRRAVKSYQNQIYKNCELIIVSDGCNRSHQIYNREFKEDSSIKFIFLDKNGAPLMYEETDKGKYYRGFPRRAGVGISTGSLITYMDSDDYLLPEFTMTLMLIYNAAPDKDWYINTSWYDSSDHSWEESDILHASDHSKSIEIEDIGGKWTPTQLKPGSIVLTPWLFMHKSTCLTKWRDTIGFSEDTDFNKRLRSEYPNGYPFERPIYVRCHYNNHWDY